MCCCGITLFREVIFSNVSTLPIIECFISTALGFLAGETDARCIELAVRVRLRLSR